MTLEKSLLALILQIQTRNNSTQELPWLFAFLQALQFCFHASGSALYGGDGLPGQVVPLLGQNKQ